MKRRRAREYALQLLFQLDLTENKLTSDLLNEFWEGIKEENEVIEYAHSIVRGTTEHIDHIDEIIRKTAEHWSLNRIAVIDKNILRAAVYELLYRKDIPASVAINEALEISKKYSSEGSSSFINGVLDRIAKDNT